MDNFKLHDIINDQDNQRQSILHISVDTGNYEACNLLIEKGADVNLKRSGFVTPLHLAAATGNLKIVELLIASGADVEAHNVMQETPLHKAATFNRVDIVEFLLKKLVLFFIYFFITIFSCKFTSPNIK